MYNPQAQTTVWRWPEGRGGRGCMEVGKRGEISTSVIVSTINNTGKKVKNKDNEKKKTSFYK